MRTNWTEVGKFYGLRPPFNFRVAIPFLLNVCLLGVIFLICAFLFLRGDLNFGTARFYFFLYLIFLLVMGAIFSKVSKLSYVIVLWCTIELGLGLGSNIVPSHRGHRSLFPYNDAVEDTSPAAGSMYHPLLQFVTRPNYSHTDRLDFGDAADMAKAAGAGVDVASLQGQELRFVHNSLGLRGKELTADDLAKDLIFVYGGSSTYDLGVTQGETWVEHLQSDLENKYTILNWGTDGHSTVESLLKTALYQNIVGKKPVCAVYYEGWNDMDEAHIEHLDSGYADFHLLRQAVRRNPLFLAQFSPLLLLANALAVRRFDSVPLPPELRQAPIAGRDERLEAVFAEHIKTIAAINEARGIRTIFIGQIYNRSWPFIRQIYNPADSKRWYLLPLVREDGIPLLVERLKSIMKDTAASIGARYIDPGIANFEGSDFVDRMHFAAKGSRKFAAMVSKQVGDYCQ
jgi:hypothetical protein